jgi:flagellar hook-associated protein 2
MPALEYFMGTTSSTSAIFKGTSAYSSDFSNVISRAVAIATLPVTQLTNNKADLSSQSDELTKLDTKFSALQSAIQKIGSALGGSAFQTSVSSDNVADVSVADGAREGVYSMKVTSIGAYETSMSTANWNVAADPSGKPTTFTLVAGNQNYSVTPADNSPQSVADAINLNYGNLVQATTVNVAPGDTRIALKSAALGQTNLDLLQVPLSAPTTSLQQQAAAGYAISQSTALWDASGSPATYTLVIGGDQHDIAPASNSAADVASAINAAYGSQVRASVVDLGSGSSHDYRISLQGTAAGPMNGSMTLDLKKGGGASLQAQQTAATSRTAAAWNAATDAAGTRTTYSLVAGSTRYTFTPADNSAASVTAAINSLYGNLVRASVVDLGTGGSPDYRISLQSKVGSSTLFDIQKTTGASFQREQTTGTLASYEINNSGVINSSATRNITISDGVTATLLGTSGGSAVDITVTRSTSAINTALSGFADAYNAAVDELGTQRGQSGGALAGQSIVGQLSALLSSISTFTSSGQISGLAGLGLDLGTDGHLTYNAFTLMSADLTNSTGVTSFLGSATGGGFLKLASDALTSLETPVTGLLKSAQTDMKSQIAKLGDTISTKQSQVDALQLKLQNQMAIADALIASMEQQYSYLSGMFSAQESANSLYK